jgi:hypothetical protein
MCGAMEELGANDNDETRGDARFFWSHIEGVLQISNNLIPVSRFDDQNMVGGIAAANGKKPRVE